MGESATVKHGGGSVMVWGYFGGSSVADIANIDGILNKEGHREILEDHAIPSGIRKLSETFIFQPDNTNISLNYVNTIYVI